MHFESFEKRTLLADTSGLLADLRMDTNRDGEINKLDNPYEDHWTSGSKGHGALILPNLDRDNTTSIAPDNWTGGVFNGKPVPPNNVIDNAADLLDIGKARLSKLVTDSIYNYTITVRLAKPTNDPTWLKNTAATDRVRVFLPSKVTSAGNTIPQAGDVAVMGPGLGDTIRFSSDPKDPNDYNIADLGGTGGFFFGIEGIKTGAAVRLEVTLEFTPIIADGPPPEPELINTDVIEFKTAPFTLLGNRQGVQTAIVENLNRYNLDIDNSAVRSALKDAFGKRLIESQTGDFWQQDGYEIGYVKTPYGQMHIVLELPRSRQFFFDPKENMRSFVRSKLLKPGIGVNTELSGSPIVDNSTLGGDIETISKPGSTTGSPGFLLMSGMPKYMRDFFSAQDVNPAINLPLDWLSVNHVDEVVQMTPNGKQILVADPDLAWALLKWAVDVDPNVRLHPKMNGNEYLPDYTTTGIKGSFLLNAAQFRSDNLEFAQRNTNLGGVYKVLRDTLKLTDEVTKPSKSTSNAGTGKLSEGGVFYAMLNNVAREYQIKFTSSSKYQLRYRDGGGWSGWFNGNKNEDQIFPDAKAYILKNYWSGTPAAGDVFGYKAVPNATLVKMPQLFGGPESLTPPSPANLVLPTQKTLSPFSVNHINSLVDGSTIVTGKAFGPIVKAMGSSKSDLFQDYVTKVFNRAGYTDIRFADTTVYHNGGGGIHCGTNAIRDIPDSNWWDSPEFA